MLKKRITIKVLILCISLILSCYLLISCTNNNGIESTNNDIQDENNADSSEIVESEENGENSEVVELPKDIEVQVPARAGGGTDVAARTLGQYISENTNSQLTIINNTAGGGTVPLETVRNANPDGSVIMHYHTAMLITTAMGMYEYDALNDFTIIGVAESVDDGTNVLVVSSDSEYQTLEDLLEYARNNPGELLFGTQMGGMSHILTGIIERETQTEFRIVEAGSDTDKLTSLVGNSIDVTLVNTNQAKQYIDGGRAIPLAVVTKTSDGGRSSVLEDVPSFVEQGYNVTFSLLNIILGPLGMDESVVDQINEFYTLAAESNKVNEILTPAGMEMRFFEREEGINRLSEMNESIKITVEELELGQ